MNQYQNPLLRINNYCNKTSNGIVNNQIVTTHKDTLWFTLQDMYEIILLNLRPPKHPAFTYPW